MPTDEEQIRAVMADWMEATAAGDLPRLLGLMSEEVVYLLPGQPPMRGREAFETRLRAALARCSLRGVSDIQEVQVEGNLAYCWNALTISITPRDGGETQHRRGPVLSVFRKETDGQWRLFRDANLLT